MKRLQKLGRRKFLTWLSGGTIGAALTGARAALPIKQRQILIQNSPLVGFQYYAGESLWPMLAVGQPLALHRRPDNPYDDRAVEVWWAEHMLGHLPRAENTAVSQMMDRGERLSVRIAGLKQSRNPWERVSLAVEWMNKV